MGRLSCSTILQLVFSAFLYSINTNVYVVAASEASNNKDYNFALIGKQINNPFFDFVYAGCQATAKLMSVDGGRNITCHYYGAVTEDAQAQAQIVEDLVNQVGSVKLDGISLSVINAEICAKSIQLARDAGIPVITFDSDAPNTARQAYIGTDNLKFGIELGKLLLQLNPEGGKYGVVAAESENVLLRVDGVTEYLAKSPWSPVADSPKFSQDRIDVALEVMWEFAADPEIQAIIAVGGWPMWNTSAWEDFVDANRHLTLISGDSLPQQLDLINQGYVNALVGQLPFNMGEMSVDVLMQIIDGTFDQTNNVLFGTAFLEILLFPLVLPPLEVDNNYLGGLVWMGYICFAVIAVLSIGFGGWTYKNRADRVVVASQPPFLYMICMGTIILASTMIPLTFDDNQYSQAANNRACMSVPWLGSIGFTTTFAALFSKLWRVNRIFHNPNQYQRVVVHAKDVLLPYGILMGANLIVLITWTVVSPMEYVRRDGTGNDGWNRVIYTYGICESTGQAQGSGAYLICLAVINFGVLVLANYQAYEARTVSTEFSESRYIAMIMASLMQAFVVGIPVVFLIREDPVPYFVVLISLMFITCLTVLLLMFWPKIVILRQKKEAEARNHKGGAMTNGFTVASEENHSEQEGGLRVRVQRRMSDSFGRSKRGAHRGSHVHVSGLDLGQPPSSSGTSVKGTAGGNNQEFISFSSDDESYRKSSYLESQEFVPPENKDLQDIEEEHSNHLYDVSDELKLDALDEVEPVRKNNAVEAHPEKVLEESSDRSGEDEVPEQHP